LIVYQPTFESVCHHPLPDWYRDAKFGIFIHWTISSVPAFAPTGQGDISQIFASKSQSEAYKYQPYSEWYQNSLRIPGSPVAEYHAKTYGMEYSYENFAQTFIEQSQAWDPEEWADLFRRAGARYTVLVTKHHDGFLLWNSRTPNPRMPAYRTTRDVTGELTRAVSAAGLKMGLYYSSALDWTFSPGAIHDFADLLSSGPGDRAYRQYVEDHWKELIDRYDPWLLWSDIGYPPDGDLPGLFAYFYNHNPDGVVNDRWFQLPRKYRNLLGRLIIKRYAARIMQEGGTTLPKVPHCDYRTAEYQDLQTRVPYQWESVRGIGNSFAYNQFETADDYLKPPALIRMLADIVSKNGNLLLNVGPRPDGSIPEPQRDAILGIGRWLTTNGEAIYSTRPWQRALDKTLEGGDIRYTQCKEKLYIILMRLPSGERLTIPSLPIRPGSDATLLGSGQPVPWRWSGGSLQLELPDGLDEDSVPVVRVELDEEHM
jgi:alpha-L-fucosidase